MVAKPLCPLYKNIIKPLDRGRYPELRSNCDLDSEDKSAIKGNASSLYYPTREKYRVFAEAFLERIATLDE